MSKYKCENCGVGFDDEKDGRLCDYHLGTSYMCSGQTDADKSRLKIKPLTCGRLLCSNCAVELWRGLDLCPTHARLVRGKIIRQMKVLPLKKQR